MKGDFSRNTFSPANHYRSVLHQQGRVSVDADFNEEAEIVNARQDGTTADVIGPTGRPKGEFAVTVDGSGTLQISAGTLYLDGVPCINDAACTLTTQPFLPLAGTAQASFPDLTGGNAYAVYLRAFERLVTAVQDPGIREKALGGADTSVRSQWAWQVRLAPVTLPATVTDCSSIVGWQPPFNPGTMAAKTVPIATGSSPCVLPPQAGFRSLENQLYRVEIHQGGPLATATCKWSRENGSVLTAVLPGTGGGTTTSGPVLNVATTGRDADLGFGNQQFVELLDDSIELSGQVQPLSTIKTVTASLNQIELQAAAGLPVQFAESARLRRWDHTGGAAGGIPIAGGDITLENGIAVTFGPGDYKAGDYWLIPARTAVDANTGTIDWPVDGLGNAIPQPSRLHEHTCLLTAVTWNGSAFAIPAGLRQCVPEFPPLTAIQATDVSYTSPCPVMDGVTTVGGALDALCQHQGPCTIVVQPPKNPGDAWWQPLLNLPAGADAEICFPAGKFPTLGQGITLTGLGNLKLSGAGAGTQITAAAGESCLTFSGCTGVSVSDMSLTTSPVDAVHLNGALTFLDCGDVQVENVIVQTGDNNVAMCSCITVRPAARNSTNTTASLRVRGCTLLAGWQQYGILGINVLRAQIEDNQILCTRPQTSVSVSTIVKYAPAAKQLASLLVSNMRVVAPVKTPGPAPAPKAKREEALKTAAGTRVRSTAAQKKAAAARPDEKSVPAAAPAPKATAAPGTTKKETTLKIGDSTVAFTSDPRLRNGFQTYVEKNLPANPTPMLVAKTIGDLAKTFVQTPTMWYSVPGMQQFGQILETYPITALRGVCLAGTTLREARIVNNTISRFRESIHVALSHSETSRGTPDIAESVLIQNNRIETEMLPGDEVAPGARLRAPFAIYVGNVNNLLILENQAVIDLANPDFKAQAAIVVYGWLGPRILVRGNSFSGFRSAIIVSTAQGMGNQYPANRLWMVTENIITGGGTIGTGAFNPPLTDPSVFNVPPPPPAKKP